MGHALRAQLYAATNEEKEKLMRSQQALSKFFEKQSAREKARQFIDRHFEMLKDRIDSDTPVKDYELEYAHGILIFLDEMQSLGY